MFFLQDDAAREVSFFRTFESSTSLRCHSHFEKSVNHVEVAFYYDVSIFPSRVGEDEGLLPCCCCWNRKLMRERQTLLPSCGIWSRLFRTLCLVRHFGIVPNKKGSKLNKHPVPRRMGGTRANSAPLSLTTARIKKQQQNENSLSPYFVLRQTTPPDRIPALLFTLLSSASLSRVVKRCPVLLHRTLYWVFIS